jgi:hypothetical protein
MLFENRMLRTIVELKKGEVIGNIVMGSWSWADISRGMHVGYWWETSERKRKPGKPRRRRGIILT